MLRLSPLQGAANALALQQKQLQASKAALSAHASVMKTSSNSFLTAAAHKCLRDSMALVTQLAADMVQLDADQDTGHTAPGWLPLQLQMQAAASEIQQALSTLPNSSLGTDRNAGPDMLPQTDGVNGIDSSATAGSEAGAPRGGVCGSHGTSPAARSGAQGGTQAAVSEGLQEQWHGKVHETIKQVLLWAQSMHTAETAGASPNAAGTYLLHKYSCFPCKKLCIRHGRIQLMFHNVLMQQHCTHACL